jgi:hypothetical protein
MSHLRRTPALLLLWLLSACSLNASVTALPTATPAPLTPPTEQPTLVPTAHRQLQSIATPTFTPDTRSSECQAGREQLLDQHIVEASIDYVARTVIVQQAVTYFNRGERPLNEVVLHVKPNDRPGVFTLNDLRLRFGPPGYQLSGQRLVIPLPEPLEPGCSLSFTLDFSLAIPPIGDRTTDGYQGYLGFGNRQLNLGRWLPVVASRQDAEWITHQDTAIGEQDVDELADYDVTLVVQHAPESLRVAAPGEPIEAGPSRWRFRLPAAREFSASLSPSYIMTTALAQSGTLVELYTFEDARSKAIDSAAFALDVASQSLDQYASLFGPYPYSRLVVVQSDFPDGMEFSGLVFVGGEYFRSFSGPQSYLMLITVHEVAHQWWYQQVGSDQALNPWLDEALATYSEYLFIEAAFPALTGWWWDFRVNTYSPQGFVDSSVYEFNSRREYINAVYLRGVRMLGDLRATLGDAAFLGWLQRYANAASGQISSPALFWSLLTPEQYAATEAIRQRYLRQPQIIVIAPSG